MLTMRGRGSNSVQQERDDRLLKQGPLMSAVRRTPEMVAHSR